MVAPNSLLAHAVLAQREREITLPTSSHDNKLILGRSTGAKHQEPHAALGYKVYRAYILQTTSQKTRDHVTLIHRATTASPSIFNAVSGPRIRTLRHRRESLRLLSRHLQPQCKPREHTRCLISVLKVSTCLYALDDNQS